MNTRDRDTDVAARSTHVGWKRPMFDRLDTPTTEELQRLLDTGDPLDSAIVELWRGRSIVSSVKAARLTREQADAILVALGEMP